MRQLMNDMELEVVTGGCDHEHTKWTGRKKIIQSPSNNDWGVRVSAFTIVKCADCGVCFYRDANGNIVETK